MAIRRAKQKAQVIEKLARSAPPGETFITTVHTETGPSPWLNALFDELPLVGMIVALSRNQYFLTVTNTSIVINSANRFNNRPGVKQMRRHSPFIRDLERDQDCLKTIKFTSFYTPLDLVVVPGDGVQGELGLVGLPLGQEGLQARGPHLGGDLQGVPCFAARVGGFTPPRVRGFVGAQFIAPARTRAYTTGAKYFREGAGRKPDATRGGGARRKVAPKTKTPRRSRGATFYRQSVLEQQSIVKENRIEEWNRRKPLHS